MDAVEPDKAPFNFYQFKYGTWVEFSDPQKPLDPMRRGYIKDVEDTRAIVIDEITAGQVSVGNCFHRILTHCNHSSRLMSVSLTSAPRKTRCFPGWTDHTLSWAKR